LLRISCSGLPSRPLVTACCTGVPLPIRPSRQQDTKTFRFDGVLADQHTAEDGSQYLHLTFNRGKESAAIIDAEFLFLTGTSFRLTWLTHPDDIF